MTEYTQGLEPPPQRISPRLQARINRIALIAAVVSVKDYTYPLPPNYQPTLPDVTREASR